MSPALLCWFFPDCASIGKNAQEIGLENELQRWRLGRRLVVNTQSQEKMIEMVTRVVVVAMDDLLLRRLLIVVSLDVQRIVTS